MNVFIYEMRQNKKSLITWAAALAVSMFVIMLATPMFLEETGGMRDTLSSLPDTFMAAMGIDIDTFFSEVGFYSYVFVYMTLVAAIQAMNLGIGIFAKENRMKTADFLMTKPVKRGAVYRQKLLAALCTLALSDIAFFISATLSISYQSGGSFNVLPFVLISLTYVFVQLIYLAMGLLIAAAADKIKSPVTVTMGVTFGTFIVGMISSIADAQSLRYLSPLRYFENSYIMLNKGYEMKYLIVGAALAVCMTAVSYVIYVRKDVKAVT